MEELFRQYWWLLFPLAWFVNSGWRSWLRYRQHKDTLEIVRDYTRSGKEPPAGLLDKLNAPEPSLGDDWDGGRRRDRRDRRGGSMGWYHVVLFGVLAAGFAYAAWTGMYGVREPFSIVAFVMAALAAAALVSALLAPRSKD